MQTDPFAVPSPRSPVAAAELRDRLAAVRLYVVTDASATAERTLEVVAAALAGGADAVQVRRKGDDGLAQLRLARECRALCSAAGALLLVNDRLDVAMAVGADGVHLGQDDLPVDEARRLWPGRLVGRSTHAPAQAVDAAGEGADYLGVGPVFATPTKPGRGATGLGYVRWAAGNVRLPWVAIGGVDETTVAEVVAAGARAVAVVRAVCSAADPREAASRLRAAVTVAGAVA